MLAPVGRSSGHQVGRGRLAGLWPGLAGNRRPGGSNPSDRRRRAAAPCGGRHLAGPAGDHRWSSRQFIDEWIPVRPYTIAATGRWWVPGTGGCRPRCADRVRWARPTSGRHWPERPTLYCQWVAGPARQHLGTGLSTFDAAEASRPERFPLWLRP